MCSSKYLLSLSFRNDSSGWYLGKASTHKLVHAQTNVRIQQKKYLPWQFQCICQFVFSYFLAENYFCYRSALVWVGRKYTHTRVFSKVFCLFFVFSEMDTIMEFWFECNVFWAVCAILYDLCFVKREKINYVAKSVLPLFCHIFFHSDCCLIKSSVIWFHFVRI